MEAEAARVPVSAKSAASTLLTSSLNTTLKYRVSALVMAGAEFVRPTESSVGAPDGVGTTVMGKVTPVTGIDPSSPPSAMVRTKESDIALLAVCRYLSFSESMSACVKVPPT